MAIKLADTTRPNNYVDAEHLGTFPVAYAEDVWFADGTRLSEKTFDGQSIQKEELPLASADELGKIYQYTGEDGTYKHGYFYECISDGEETPTYSWRELGSGGSITIKDVNELPTTNIENIIYRLTSSAYYAGDTINQQTEQLAKYDDIPDVSKKPNIFTGTQAEWDALTNDEKAQYSIVNITDDTNPNGKFIDITSQCTVVLGTAKVMKCGQIVVINGYNPKVTGSDGFRTAITGVPKPISNGTSNSAYGSTMLYSTSMITKVNNSTLSVYCSTSYAQEYSIIYLTDE